MTTEAEERGELADNVIRNRRRLGVAHLVLGVSSGAAYHFGPWGYHPTSLLATLSRDYALAAVLATVGAWIPFVISWRYSVSLLAGSSRASAVFIAWAAVVTIALASIDLNLLALTERPSAIAVSIVVTAALTVAVRICADVAQRV